MLNLFHIYAYFIIFHHINTHIHTHPHASFCISLAFIHMRGVRACVYVCVVRVPFWFYIQRYSVRADLYVHTYRKRNSENQRERERGRGVMVMEGAGKQGLCTMMRKKSHKEWNWLGMFFCVRLRTAVTVGCFSV